MKRKLIVGIPLTIILILIVVTWLAGSLLTAPAHQSVGPPPAGSSFTTVQFPSQSGSLIHGWFLHGKPGTGAVILMHGVRSNRLSMIDRAHFLSRAGYSVLLFDFQAHGESTGKQITFGSLESKDAQAAVQFVRENAPGEKIGIIGVSMGGAAAILAEPTIKVDACVFEMVYPTITEAVNNRLTMRLGNWSRVLSPLLLVQLQPRIGVDARALRPVDQINRIKVPKLFIAGAGDEHTTVQESQRLYETASQPKELWVIQGAKHVDLHHVAQVEYERRVLEFFAKYLS